MTVQPLPATTIGGSNFVCSSGSLTLAGGPTGGTWSGGSAAVATVNSSGVVTPVAVGTTVVTYSATNSCGTVSDTQAVTVEAPFAAPSYRGAAPSFCVTTGSTHAFDTSGPGWEFSPSGGTFTLSSTFPSVGSISGRVLTFSGSLGSATVTYTVANSCGSHYATTTVNTDHLVVGATGPGTLCAGASVTCIGSPGGGTWASSASGIVSVVASTGVATAASGVTGTAILTYSRSSALACGGSFLTTTINVVAPAAITGPTNVCGGQSITLSESVRGGTWSCTPTYLASIDASGTVTAATVGTISTATATYTCGTASVSYTVTVNPTPSPPTIYGVPAAMCYGTTASITASPAGGAWSGLPAGTTPWASLSALSGSPVTLTSLVTPTISGGSAGAIFNVHYTVTNAAGCSSTQSAGCIGNPNVTAGTISGLTSICVGRSIALTTSGDIGGSWSSSNTAVASVNLSSGVVTYVGPGTATITYTISNPCGTSTATYNITCYGVPTAGTLSTSTSVICAGASATITSTGPTTFGTWSSTNPAVATVTGSGALTGSVTGVSAGSADIIYSISNPCGSATASYTINVNPAPVINGFTNICAGSSTPVYPVPGSIFATPLTGVTWSMGTSASIATISGTTGRVTGVGAGTGTISCTISATGCTATRNIVVNALPLIIFTNPYPLVACGGTFILNVGTPGTYTWYGATLPVGGATGSSVTISSLSFGGSATSIYTVTTTDVYGCSATAFDTVVSPDCGPGVCASVGTSPVYALAGTYGSISFPAGNYYIYGDVTFNGTTAFTNAIMPIAAGKTIYVGPNGSLDIDGSHLYTCSNSALWQGIVLNSSTGTGARTGTVNIHGNSLLEDAVTGIRMNGGYLRGSTNLITADGAIFNRNSIGISIENFPSATGTVALPYNYPFVVRNCVFTSRKLDVYNNGTTTHYPSVWPPTTGGSLALKFAWTPPVSMMPPYNLFSPTGAGTVSGAYGGRYNPAACKDGSVANIGVQLLNTGEFSSGIGNVPATFGNVVIGDNAGYTGVNTRLNLFDTLQEGIYAYNSNFISYNSAFAYMYMAGSAIPPVLAGDGIGAYATTPAATMAASYPKYNMSVSGNAGANPTNNSFYGCRVGVRNYGYYYISGKNASIYGSGLDGYWLQSPRYYQLSIRGNTITNVKVGVEVSAIPLLGASGGAINQLTGLMNISNNTIQANLPGATPSAGLYVNNGIRVNTVATAAGTLGYGTRDTAHIDTNSMYDVYNGIEANNFQNQPLTSDSNFIRLRYPTGGVAALSTNIGILHAGCMTNYIRANAIVGPGPAMPAPVFTAFLTSPNIIGIEGNLNVNAEVRCNIVDSVVTGFYFTGAGNTTHWYNNVMKDNSYGMALRGTFGRQYGSAGVTSPAFNDWRGGTSAWSGTGAAGTHYNTYTLNNTSPPGDVINVTSNFGPYIFNPTNNSGRWIASTWYGFGTSTTSTTPYFGLVYITGVGDPIPPNCVEVHGSPVYYPLQRAANTQQFAGSGGKPLNFIAQNNLYRLLLADSTLADSSALLAAFKSRADLSRYGWLASIERAIATGDEVTANGLLSAGIDDYVDTTSDTATGLVMQDDVAADYVVDNYLTLYHATLGYLDSTLTGADSLKVLALAQLCPYLNGNVVFQGRALYRILYNDDTSVFADTCTLDGAGLGARRAISESSNNESQEYRIFPNPNDGILFVEQTRPDKRPVHVVIKDVIGKVVYNSSIIFSAEKASIELTNIPKGVYIVQLSGQDTMQNTFKIIVQ